jgi:hypothetical protein
MCNDCYAITFKGLGIYDNLKNIATYLIDIGNQENPWFHLYTFPASGLAPEDTGGAWVAAGGGCIGPGYFISTGGGPYAGPQETPGGGCVVGVISGRMLCLKVSTGFTSNLIFIGESRTSLPE